MTKIEWCEQTWNPIVGCSVTSPGCTNCYAMRQAHRLASNPATPHYAGTTQMTRGGPVFNGKVALAPDHALTAPLRRRKPTVYFVNSMGDLFHESVPDEWIDHVFAIMALTPQHTYQALTKRADRMQEYMIGCRGRVRDYVSDRHSRCWPFDIWHPIGVERFASAEQTVLNDWPLPNVWLGVSAEDQTRADQRIPDLLATPAAVRFVSVEPMLGPVDLERWLSIHWQCSYCRGYFGREYTKRCPDCGKYDGMTGSHRFNGRNRRSDTIFPSQSGQGIDWVICGGESGGSARPMHPEWARSLRDQCAAAGVPFFFKQWGEWQPYSQYDERTGPKLYDDPPKSRPLDTVRGRYDRICMNADGTTFDLGRKGGFSIAPEGAFTDATAMTMFRIGKKAAGRLLDGVQHDGRPQ